MKRLTPAPILIALIAAVCAAPAAAQVRSAAQIESGYGSSADVMDKAFDPSTRDERGNRIILDGVIQSGSGNSAVSLNGEGTLAGAEYFQSGATSMTATAIGNLVNIDVSGNWNTIVLNSSQVNNGSQTASAVLNGRKISSGESQTPATGQ